MPTLVRLLTVLGLLAALVYGAAYAIVTLVRPEPRHIEEPIALPRPAR